MRKIFYNNKLKKIIFVFIIIVIVLNFIGTNFTVAMNADGSGQINQPTDQEGEDDQTPTNNTKSGSIATMREWMKDGAQNWLDDTAKNSFDTRINAKIKGQIQDITNRDINDIKNKFKNDEDKIKVTCEWSAGPNSSEGGNIPGSYGYFYHFEQWNVEVNLTAEDIDTAIEEGNASREENDGSWVDTIGGILLEPVFFLVNFVADALICMLDGMMLDGDFSVIPSAMIISVTGEEDYTYEGEPNYIDSISNNVGFANYPAIRYSPEKIFSGQVPILSIDFISGGSRGTPLVEVRTTIASWYKALRLFAIIGFLSVLIYTGIRITISANTKDKAKYKEWIINWFMGLAILFCMHYIMSFIITVTDEVNTLLENTVSDGVKAQITVDGETKRFKTNLIGICRFMVQADSFTTKIGYEVMYIALIVYTFKFTFVYLKRVLNMAFLTLIAPLVALMYPIDKMSDGSAQAFDMWFKEYIFNALLQPMHMLMYYVLVSSAIQVAVSNPLYGIIVLAFMSEAEKLFKKIFGFDKAHGGTVGSMGNAFAAGAVASQIGKYARGLGPGHGGKNGGNGNGNRELPEMPTRNKDVDNIESGFNMENDERDEPNQDSDENAIPTTEMDGGDRLAANRIETTGNQENQNGNNPVEVNSEDQEIDSNEDEDYPTRERQNDEDPIERARRRRRQEEMATNEQDSTSTIGSISSNTSKDKKRNRLITGAKSLGKRIARPVWDFDNGAKYNGKRLIRKVAKGATGFAVGATAAAVQAGISITDGKYNPMEGIATFGAGWIGGTKVAGGAYNKAISLKGTFDQGYHSEDTDEQKRKWEEKQRKRYHENWSNRDDVNRVFRQQFGESKFKKMKADAIHYTDRGYNDPQEVAKLMKASNNLGWDAKKTIQMSNFKKQLQQEQMYGAVYDKDKQQKYIDSIIKNNNYTGQTKTRAQNYYEKAFKDLAMFNSQMK